MADEDEQRGWIAHYWAERARKETGPPVWCVLSALADGALLDRTGYLPAHVREWKAAQRDTVRAMRRVAETARELAVALDTLGEEGRARLFPIPSLFVSVPPGGNIRDLLRWLANEAEAQCDGEREAGP